VDLVEQADPSSAEGATAARHPWEVARYRFFADVLRRAGLLGGPASILDAGAGDGWFTRTLVESSPRVARAVCWDAHYTPEHLARRDPRVSYRRERPAERFEVVLLLDVLEHVEDDLDFLRRTRDENLAPGGHLLISVPAWPALTTAHDDKLGHQRRYTPAAARALVAAVGLGIVRGGGLFHSLLGPRALATLRERLGAPDEAPPSLAWRRGPFVTAAVAWALRLDGTLSTWAADLGLDLPGLSWWALCRTSS
jgi:SAM-dependent methyltransferase